MPNLTLAETEQGEEAKFSKTSALTAAITAIGLLCFSITPASAKDQPKKDDCALGEVSVADGVGGVICLPYGAWGLRVGDGSSCPCDILFSTDLPFLWREADEIECEETSVSPFDRFSIFAKNSSDMEISRVGVIEFTNPDPDVGSCFRDEADGVAVEDEIITEQAERDDCVADVQALAFTLGLVCPAPPVVVIP